MSRQHTEKIKDIPGFKFILRAVIKSQIGLLSDLLQEHVQDECCLLIASPAEGSHEEIGTSDGQRFVEDNNVSGKFLEFCLKRHRATLPQDILTSVSSYQKQDSQNHGQSLSDRYPGFCHSTSLLPRNKHHTRSPGSDQTPIPGVIEAWQNRSCLAPCTQAIKHIPKTTNMKILI